MPIQVSINVSISSKRPHAGRNVHESETLHADVPESASSSAVVDSIREALQEKYGGEFTELDALDLGL